MRKFLFSCFVLCGAMAAYAQTPAVTATVVLDPTQSLGAINRGLFSYVNYQDLVDAGSPLALKAMKDLSLAGGHQRLASDPVGFAPQKGVFDAAALFKTNVFRGKELVERVKADGMIPMLLLAYNLPWLSPDGNVIKPPTDPSAWADFAVAALKSVPEVKIVEIWNEPDTELYWKGSKEEFYRFFNLVAERIHAECPGVLVGGPAALNSTSPWALGFIDACGSSLDVSIYHSYNEVPEMLVERIGKMADYLKKKTGRVVPIVLSESDNFDFTGALKFDYLMRRQALLQGPEAKTVLAFHQFQARAYREGSRYFGMVAPDGKIIADNYWAFWMYRYFRGDRVAVQAASADPLVNKQLVALGSVSESAVQALVYLPVQARKKTKVTVTVPVPEGFSQAMVQVSRAGDGLRPGVEKAEPLAGRASVTQDFDLSPGQAAAVTLLKPEGEDLVWVDVTPSTTEMLVGDAMDVTVRVLNKSPFPIDGKVSLAGVPTDWDIAVVEEGKDAISLVSGAETTVKFRMASRSVTPDDGMPLFAFAAVRKAGERITRIPSFSSVVKALAPVEMSVRPYRLFVAPGQTVSVDALLRNSFSSDVAGTVKLDAEGFTTSPPVKKAIAFAKTEKATLSLTAGKSLKVGEYTGSLVFDYNGNQFRSPFDIIVADFALNQKTVTVDLKSSYNADGITAVTDFNDFKDFGGRFTLPAEYLPAAGKVNYLGIDFLFPDSAAKALNLVQTKGQTLTVPKGKYNSLAMLVTATNSNKRESLVVTYDDGTFADLSFNVTDWCVAPKNGEIPVVKAPLRHIPEGLLVDAKPQIYLVKYPVDPKKNVVSVTLPTRLELYIASMSFVR